MKKGSYVLHKKLTSRQYRSENGFMGPVAGILNKLMVATPLVVVITLGLHARSAFEPFRYTAYSSNHDQQVSNYIDVVRATEHTAQTMYLIREPQALKLADAWIQGTKSGYLKQLTPICIEDSSRDGVKSQIVRDCTLVAESLNYASEKRLRSHDDRDALNDALRAAQTVQSTKYFDFASLAVCSMVQRKSMSLIAECTRQLSSEEKLGLKSQIEALSAPRNTIKQMSLDARVFAAQRTDDSDAVSTYFSAAESASSTKSLEEATRHIPKAAASNDGELLDLINDFRLGITAADDTNHHIAELAHSL